VKPLLDLTKNQRRAILALALLAVAALAYANQIAETDLNVELEALFLAPIAIVAWAYPRRFSLLFALAVTVLAALSDAGIRRYPAPQLAFEFAVHAAVFLSAAFVVNLLADLLSQQTHRARFDALTDSANAERFREFAALELDRSKRYNRPVTVAFVDLDNFKMVNDRYGHLAGDEALRSMAGLMREHLRGTDVVGRLGGDEFGILMPETGEDEARAVLERVRARIAERAAAMGWPITASIGAAATCGAGRDVRSEDVLARADNAMYRVKSSSKDDVCIEVFD